MIQHEPVIFCLNPLRLSIQSGPLLSHPSFLNRQVLLGLSYLISQLCDLRVMLIFIIRGNLYSQQCRPGVQ